MISSRLPALRVGADTGSWTNNQAPQNSGTEVPLAPIICYFAASKRRLANFSAE